MSCHMLTARHCCFCSATSQIRPGKINGPSAGVPLHVAARMQALEMQQCSWSAEPAIVGVRGLQQGLAQLQAKFEPTAPRPERELSAAVLACERSCAGIS